MARTMVLAAGFAALMVLASWIFVPADSAVGAATPTPNVERSGGGPEAAIALSIASTPAIPTAGF